MDTAASPPTNMRSLERAIDVLEVLDNSRHPLRLTEVAKRAGLHVATTQRILHVLEARGRVERDAAGYRPGIAMLFGAYAYLLTSPLVTASRPVLQELADATGLTSSLFARSGQSRAVIARIEGTSPMRYVLPTGERLPLSQGAGKVLAAYLSKEDLAELLDTDEPITTGTGTPVGRDEFAAELSRIRADGYLHSHQGRAIGVASVAAPILDAEGHCIAGVQVAGSITDLTEERVPALEIEVRRAAAVIAERLG